MKRATSIFLAFLVMLSLSILIPSTAHASDGSGQPVVKVEHVKVNFHMKPLSAAQLKALSSSLHRHTSSASPNTIAADACAAVPNDHNCDGQDPTYQGCSPSAENAASSTFDVEIAKNDWVPIGEVYLRYSINCQSNWAHGYSGYDWPDPNNGDVYHWDLEAVKVVRDDGLTEEYDQPTETEGWSNMVYAPVRKTKACILLGSWTSFPNGGGNGGDVWYCTGFY